MPSAKVKGAQYVDLTFAIFGLLVFILGIFNLGVYLNDKPHVVLGAETNQSDERYYWEHIAATNPTYRDAWLEIASLEAEAGNVEYARSLILRAKSIDPNSIKIMNLEKQILGK